MGEEEAGDASFTSPQAGGGLSRTRGSGVARPLPRTYGEPQPYGHGMGARRLRPPGRGWETGREHGGSAHRGGVGRGTAPSITAGMG